MSFIIYLIIGFFSGLLGGMGMGGGTVLIPALTIIMGVEQHVAQATSLIAFLPTATLSLSIHKKNGLISYGGVWYLIIPAVITSVLGGLIAARLSAVVLKKLFGVFLIALGVKGLFSLKLKPTG